MDDTNSLERSTDPSSGGSPRRKATWAFWAAIGAFVLLYVWAATTALQLRVHGRFPVTFWPMGVLDLLNAVVFLNFGVSTWRDGSRFRRRVDRNAVLVLAALLVAWNALRAAERLLG